MGDGVDGWRVVELCACWRPAGFRGLYRYAHLPLYSPLVQSAAAEVARRDEFTQYIHTPGCGEHVRSP
jgi:hypothetical protein